MTDGMAERIPQRPPNGFAACRIDPGSEDYGRSTGYDLLRGTVVQCRECGTCGRLAGSAEGNVIQSLIPANTLGRIPSNATRSTADAV